MTAADAVAALGVDPAAWRGTLHLHLGGKTGELLYFSGCLPGLRRALPFARLALHVHPHYLGVVPGLRHRPDELIAAQGYPEDLPLALQVTAYIRACLTDHPPWWGGVGDVHTCLYQDHGVYRAPFYRQWAKYLGVGWERPEWAPTAPPRFESGKMLLALPTANQHAGSRLLPLSPPTWRELAARSRALGLLPVATGQAEDGQPEMPDWTWLDLPGPEDVLALLPRCRAVLGHNSGMTWAAMLLAPGRVLMLDSQRVHERLYEFEDCVEDGVAVLDRHHRVRADRLGANHDLAWLLG